MVPVIKIVAAPENLDENWDQLASCYFQKKEFLLHLHRYNPCNQRYYQFYNGNTLVAGAVVYTLKINLFTFSGLKTCLKMTVIGLPVSVASSSLVGNPDEFENLFNFILHHEKGVILGMNMPPGLILKKIIPMRTLPTIIFANRFIDFESYMQALRHPYRRRIRTILGKAAGVEYVVTPCSDFTALHYRLYLEIMKRTKTKLETLSFDLFKNLPGNFTLGSEYYNSKLLAWHTLCYDGEDLYFFFGGMDYEQRDTFNSYYNNLISILITGITHHFSRIDFGQTAETAKMRLGGLPDERDMFLYHKNPLIRLVFTLARPLVTYKRKPDRANVFK